MFNAPITASTILNKVFIESEISVIGISTELTNLT